MLILRELNDVIICANTTNIKSRHIKSTNVTTGIHPALQPSGIAQLNIAYVIKLKLSTQC